MKLRRPLIAALLALAVLWVVPASADAKVVWLCKPGKKADPCEPSLTTTVYSASGKREGVDHIRRAARADCFYVYPTVSDQPRPQATKVVDDVLRSIALFQAARYSRDCRVYAPVYRQVTIQGLFNPQTVTPEMGEQAYADVREAWRTYLRKFNKGRGVIFIGHSQGTFVLRRLIGEEVDSKPAVRRRLVSAILLGGNVTVKKGSDRGGDFSNIPACRATHQVGCVVAFSSFNGPVPPNALFGRSSNPELEVLCTNPGRLRGGPEAVTAIYPTKPFARSVIGAAANASLRGVPRPRTAWAAIRQANRAQCSNADGANVLQLTPTSNVFSLTPIPDANWGTHLVDANIALGNLANLARRQIALYMRR